MTEEVRKCVEILRYCDESGGCCGGCPSGKTNGIPNCYSISHIADLIESLSAQLDQVTRERDAAVEDMRSILGTGLCYVCKKKHMVLDETGAYICEVFDRSLNPDPTFCGQFEWRGVEVEG